MPGSNELAWAPADAADARMALAIGGAMKTTHLATWTGLMLAFALTGCGDDTVGPTSDSGAPPHFDATAGDSGAARSEDAAAFDANSATPDAHATTPPPDASEVPDASADASDASVFSDNQIVGIVEAINTGEIREALLATGNGGDDAGENGEEAGIDAGAARSTNPRVLAFADMMITHHSQSNATIETYGIAPASSLVESSLQATVQSTLADLEPRSGASFDSAYASAQVMGHQTALAVVTDQLIPSAQNATLKAYLQGTLVPTIQSHLAAAQALVAALGGDAAADAASSDE